MTQDQGSREHQQMKLVVNALEEDHRATSEEFSRAMGVPATSVFRILTNYLKERKISARWVPRSLTSERKQSRLDIATLLKERLDVEDQAFLRRIVPIDETWIRDFASELKSQSNEWRAIGSPRPKKFDVLNQTSSK